MKPRTKTSDVTAKNIVLNHISRIAFGELKKFAHPVTRQIAAKALIFIDGLDEVAIDRRSYVIGAINSFAQDKTLGQNILVVTTRPIAEKLLGFKHAEIRPLLAGEVTNELANDSSRVRDMDKMLKQQLSQRPPDAQTSLPDWRQIDPFQTAALLHSFGDKFGFLTAARDPAGGNEQFPFLRTYRDIEIFQQLFIDTMTGAFEPPPRTPDEMQTLLIIRYLRIRSAMNYYRLKELSAAKIYDAWAQRVIDTLAAYCANYLTQAGETTTPEAPRFAFSPAQFEHTYFDSVPLHDVLVESELLYEKGGHLVFDNPEIDKYFFARSQDLRSHHPGAPE